MWTKQEVSERTRWRTDGGCSRDVAVAALALVVRGYRRTRQPPAVTPARRSDLEALAAELAMLKQENSSLRQIVSASGELTQGLTATTDAIPEDDQSVRRWEALIEASVMRTALAAMCRDLEAAVTQMHLRLSSMPPDSTPGGSAQYAEGTSVSYTHLTLPTTPYV